MIYYGLFWVTYLMIINYLCLVSNCRIIRRKHITHIARNYSVVRTEVPIGSQCSIDQFYSQTAWSELTRSVCHVSVFPDRVYLNNPSYHITSAVFRQTHISEFIIEGTDAICSTNSKLSSPPVKLTHF